MTHDEALDSPLGRYLLQFCYCGNSSRPGADAGSAPAADTCRIHYALASIDPVLAEQKARYSDLLQSHHSLCTQLAEAKEKREQTERLINELREIVDLAVDIGGIRFHEERCPEDDTCDCSDVKRVNDAMGRDWKSKREPNSINLPTSEKRNEVLTYPVEKCERCGREHKLAGVPCPCRFA